MTVIRSTAGVCRWLRQQLPNAAERGICVGFDAAKTSRELATDSAGVIAAAGFQVWMLDDAMPTPVLAFSVLETGAAAGLMITGGVGPASGEGYAVFGANGARVLPLQEEAIAREIDGIDSASNVPKWTRHQATAQGRMQALNDLVERYRERVVSLVGPAFEARRLPIAYTALHGVGGRLVRVVLGANGFNGLKNVAAEADPDGRFTTFESLDPREPEALEKVLALGKKIGAELVLANDPEAGCLVVAAPSGEGYEVLSSDDVGCMLADDLLEQGARDSKRLVLSTGGSSSLLGKIAEAHGARWEQTDAGQAGIQQRAFELEAEGYRYVLGFDDFGYAATTFVRDRDGVSAALLIADLAARCKASGSTLLDQRDAVCRKYAG